MGMYAKIRETATETILFVFRNLFIRLLGFLLLPVYTNSFHPKEYGRLTLMLTTEAFLTQVLQFGLTTSYFRSFFDDEKDERRRLITSTTVWFLVGVNLLFFLAALPFAGWYGRLL